MKYGTCVRLVLGVVLPELLLVLSCGTLWGGQPVSPLSIRPDSKIQALIRQVVYAKETDHDTRTAMSALNELAFKTPELLAPQLIYFDIHVQNEKEGLGMIGLAKHFVARWGPEMRSALIPLLETSDTKVHSGVSRWLFGIDGYFSATPEKSMSLYGDVLERTKAAPPGGLVDYVFDLSPSAALLLLGEIYSEKKEVPPSPPRSLIWSNHVITTIEWRARNRFLQEGDLEKAQRELDALSKHKGWYARRYVVEFLGINPRFGTPDIFNRLQNDPNPLVAEPAKALKDPRQKQN